MATKPMSYKALAKEKGMAYTVTDTPPASVGILLGFQVLPHACLFIMYHELTLRVCLWTARVPLHLVS